MQQEHNMNKVKYLHICGDTGSITMLNDEPVENLYGWVVEVPVTFKLTLDLSNITNHMYVYEAVMAHRDARIIQQH